MDVNNALQPAVAHPPAPASDSPGPPCDARWRQRGVGGVPDGIDGIDDREHVELPLDGAAAATPPAVEPQWASRDAELWRLARRTQGGATLRLAFELRTTLVRQVFRRDFVFVSRQLHALEASRRVQGLDRACLDDALAALRQRADAMQARWHALADDLRTAIAARGPASARLAFARAERFQATIVSPAAHRYLTLLAQADETLAWLEMAWLLGLVEPERRTALAGECRRALHGFKHLACDRRAAVGTRVRKLNGQRRESARTASGGTRDG